MAGRLQEGSSARERGCHIAQNVCTSYFGLSANNTGIYAIASK